MTHEGRMKRGELNFNKGLLDNADTKYFLEHREVPTEYNEPTNEYVPESKPRRSKK